MTSERDDQGRGHPAALVLRGLLVLTAFTLGGLVAMVIVNRLLVAQLAVYGEAHMAAGSAMLDFMDDILPYLAGYMVGFALLAAATLAVWIWTQLRVPYRRYGMALPALVLVVVVVWLVGGRSTAVTSVPMMTPTPVP